MHDATADEIRKGRGPAKDLEREMEQILEPLGVAVEAAGSVLRDYACEKYLNNDVAEIVGCAVNASYAIAYNQLIELASRATLPAEAATSRPNASSGPSSGAGGSE